MTKEQKELLTYIHYTLEMNVNDKSKTYEYSIEEAGKVTTLEVNREEHLEEIIRWALQELEKHFELIPKLEAEDETTENNRLEKILEVIEGMPKYEWDRIVQEVNKAYSHKTVKVELDSHSCEVIRKSLS
nr:hypothetical protein [Staphylococcus epidermidis]